MEIKSDLDKALVKDCEKEKWDCVKLLVEAGADVNGGDSRWKPMNYAPYHSNAEYVDLLLKAGADVNHWNRTTSLNLASDVKVAELLIKAGADVNSAIYDHADTPLTSAASLGRVDLVKLLIDSGANVNQSSIYGTPLQVAVGRNNVDCVKLLVPHVNDKDPFLLASKSGHVECVKIFLDSGVDVNAKIGIHEQRKQNTVTALMKAASGNQLECVEFLIKQGASVKDLDDFGNNILMFASMECKVETMEYFIKQGMNVNACNKEKETALMKVIDQPYIFYGLMGTSFWEQNDCHSDCVKLLVESGADVNKRNAAGDTALNLAAKQNQPEYIKILLAAGAHINVFNKAGCNAFMCHEQESKRKNEDVKMILFAAGESKKRFKSRDMFRASPDVSKSTFNSFLEFMHIKRKSCKTVLNIAEWSCWADENHDFSLKNMCREVIRRCLLLLDPFRNLFDRVPLVGLPRSLISYLLFEIDLSLMKPNESAQSEKSNDKVE